MDRKADLLKRIEQYKKILANITLKKEVRLRIEDNLKILEGEVKKYDYAGLAVAH